MQTHRDDNHPTDFIKRLRERATEDKPHSRITAGADGEPILAQWKSNGVFVRHLPDDEQGILRISVGGSETPVNLNYLTFRGSHGKCVDLLRKALAALEKTP